MVNASARDNTLKTPKTQCRMVQSGLGREVELAQAKKVAGAEVAAKMSRNAVVGVAGDVAMMWEDAGEVAVWFAVAGNDAVAVEVEVAVKVTMEVAGRSQWSQEVAGIMGNVAGVCGNVAGLGETILDGADVVGECGTMMEQWNAFAGEMREVGCNVGRNVGRNVRRNVGSKGRNVGKALEAMGSGGSGAEGLLWQTARSRLFSLKCDAVARSGPRTVRLYEE